MSLGSVKVPVYAKTTGGLLEIMDHSLFVRLGDYTQLQQSCDDLQRQIESLSKQLRDSAVTYIDRESEISQNEQYLSNVVTQIRRVIGNYADDSSRVELIKDILEKPWPFAKPDTKEQREQDARNLLKTPEQLAADYWGRGDVTPLDAAAAMTPVQRRPLSDVNSPL